MLVTCGLALIPCIEDDKIKKFVKINKMAQK